VSDHDYLNGISYALVILLRPRCAFTATHVKAGNPARTKRCDNQNGNNQNGDNQSARIDLRAIETIGDEVRARPDRLMEKASHVLSELISVSLSPRLQYFLENLV